MKPAHRRIEIIGIPMDLGGGRRGVDMGPSAVRAAGLQQALRRLGHEVRDRGNIAVPLAETCEQGDPRQKYAHEIMRSCADLSRLVEEIVGAGGTPLALGGDHAIAIGSVSGVARHWHGLGQKIGLIWFDAHADMNTPDTSPSGNVHGMPLAAVLGFGSPDLLALNPIREAGNAFSVSPANTVLIGIRDVDSGERELIERLRLRAFTMSDIDERGMAAVLNESIRIACDGTAGFHCTFDMDCVDPDAAPGVGTSVIGGPSFRESHLALEKIARSGKMLSMDLTEVNALLDERNKTGALAAHLIASAFGKTIL